MTFSLYKKSLSFEYMFIGELYKWTDAPSMNTYLQKLDGDIGSNSKWRKYMEDNGKSSMDAWRYLAKKYPDKNHWCLP
jgi:hypothetical protein